jgi:hypothetical protein
VTTYKIDGYDIRVVHPPGFKWDTGSFGIHDWELFAHYILENGVRRILEVGAGLSSLLLSQLCRVDSLEHDPTWADKVEKTQTDIHKLRVFRWLDRMVWPVPDSEKYDLVFIDGPEELDPAKREELKLPEFPRMVSFENAWRHSDVIFVHDSIRVSEMYYQLLHLAPYFRHVEIIRSDQQKEIERFMSVWKRWGT